MKGYLVQVLVQSIDCVAECSIYCGDNGKPLITKTKEQLVEVVLTVCKENMMDGDGIKYTIKSNSITISNEDMFFTVKWIALDGNTPNLYKDLNGIFMNS